MLVLLAVASWTVYVVIAWNMALETQLYSLQQRLRTVEDKLDAASRELEVKR